MSSAATSVPEAGIGAKLNILWTTNKPVFIAIIAALVLFVFGIIFLILWFTVIKPNQNSSGSSNSSNTATVSANSTVKATHMIFESGRQIRSLWSAII
jgi:ABC-type bacteriocin/lantibiotic exporter with double-glycine peptidase domain